MLLLHYDLVSPASAVAVLRLQRLADAGYDVRFLGLDPLGLEVGVPVTLEQLEEHERWHGEAARLGLEMRRPTWRPPTLRAHLVGDLAERVGLGSAWRSRGLRAYWTAQQDLGDRAVLERLAIETGLDATSVREMLDDPKQVLAARQRAGAIVRRGVGGVPVLEAHGTFVSAHLDEASLVELASR